MKKELSNLKKSSRIKSMKLLASLLKKKMKFLISKLSSKKKDNKLKFKRNAWLRKLLNCMINSNRPVIDSFN